jgi:hypothetical protein
MTHSTPQTPIALQDMLYELSLAKDVPDPELLDEFVRRYPEHAVVLTDFAVELAVDSLRPDAAEAPVDASRPSPAVSRAMSKFESALQKLRASGAIPTARCGIRAAAVENPFAKYDRAGFRRLALDLHANSLFTCKLRDREIEPTTMTDGFRRFVAGTMEVPLELVTAHFSAPAALLPQGQFHKSERKPEAGRQQSFEEAVRSSHLTEEQQRFLLNL